MKARRSPKRVQKVARSQRFPYALSQNWLRWKAPFVYEYVDWCGSSGQQHLGSHSKAKGPSHRWIDVHLISVCAFLHSNRASRKKGVKGVLYTARALVAICALAVFAASSWESYFPRFRIQRGPTLFSRARNVVQHEVHEMRSIICSVHFIVIWRRPRSERDEPPPRSRCITYCGANALPNVCRRWNYTSAARFQLYGGARTYILCGARAFLNLTLISLAACGWLIIIWFVNCYIWRERSKVLQRKWRLDRDLLYNG